jgi:hypothetical protein
MRRRDKWLRVLAALAIVANVAGCTKRVQVAPNDYSEVIGGEDFIHVTTTDGGVYQLQEAQLIDNSVTGLLRHGKGDVKPVGAGGVESESAFIEIRLEDVRSLEVERINKKRVLLMFGAVAAGLAATIIAVEASDLGGGGGGGGDIPIKPF